MGSFDSGNEVCFDKMRGISCLADELSASQEGHYIIKFYGIKSTQ